MMIFMRWRGLEVNAGVTVAMLSMCIATSAVLALMLRRLRS
jgi:hypothetical protein